MPIWKVSLTDGTYQVADADGTLYPLTMGGQPVTRFNEGWSPRGLQTGLPPLHVLELEHASEESACWLHDETLDYRANAVPGLAPGDQDRFFAHMDPIVRTLYAECVLAPHAAIPSVAHQFDGMLPRTVLMLIADSVRRTMPASDVVVLDQLQEIGAGYGNGVNALSQDWIARSIAAPASAAQERFDLPGRRCTRHLDPATGTVFYVMNSDDPAETSLFVPSSRVVVVRSRYSHDPLLLLLHYYAGNTSRAVSMPEALDLPPEMVVPAQYGLDEPPAPEPSPVMPEAVVPEAAAPDARDAVHAPAPTAERTVFEAPLAETGHAGDPTGTPLPQHDPHTYQTGREEPREQPMPDAPVRAVPVEPVRAQPLPASRPASPPPRAQNWWQRLLGLGNP